MSKIGKISIAIPEKVKLAFSENILNVEGPLGKKKNKYWSRNFWDKYKWR